MDKVRVEEKDAFFLTGYGRELESAVYDMPGLLGEKSEFWKTLAKDGRLDTLKQMASDDFVYACNAISEGKMFYYLSVKTEEETPSGMDRGEFPAKEYVIIPGEADSVDALNQQLTQRAFGKVLPELKGYEYRGAPNVLAMKEEKDGSASGEVWIPVERKETDDRKAD